VVLSDGLGDIRLISNDAAGVTTQGMRLYMMQDDLALTSGSKTGLLVDESFSGSYVVNPASGTLNWTGMEVRGPALDASGTFAGAFTAFKISTELIDSPSGSTVIIADFNPITSSITTTPTYGLLMRVGLSSFGGGSNFPVSTLTSGGSFGTNLITYSDDTTPLPLTAEHYTVLGDATTG